MQITSRTTIDRPAAQVWGILGPRFADASVWASSIDSSLGVGEATLAGAPFQARECRVAVAGADRLVEELVSYDDRARALTYTVADGMQHVARSARNTWSVVALGETRSELRIDAEVDLSRAGRALAVVLRPYLGAMVRRNAADLRVYVETGAPSRRKLMTQAGGRSLARLVAGNAVFTTLAGAALTIGAGWWASGQFGGVAEPVVTLLGSALMGYAVCLAWISGREVSARTGKWLARLDAAWVVGTAAVLALYGSAFSTTGLTAAVSTATIVAAFGWFQWRASSRAPAQP